MSEGKDWQTTIEALAESAPRAANALRRTLDAHPELGSTAEAMATTCQMLLRCLRSGGTLYLCGNGGSYADAQHIAGELVKSFQRRRPIPDDLRTRLLTYPGGESLALHLERGLRAMPLGTNGAAASAVENDSPARYMAYAQELYALARPGDMLIGISTSGNAQNVYNAAVTAKALGLTVIGLTGERDSRLSTIADAIIRAPATVTAEVQACHIRLYHALCEMVEDEEFGDTPR